MKWGITAANIKDFSRPPELLSVPQQSAVALTGLIWCKYSLDIIPKNYNLLSVNFVMAATGLYQLYRRNRFDGLTRNSKLSSAGPTTWNMYSECMHSHLKHATVKGLWLCRTRHSSKYFQIGVSLISLDLRTFLCACRKVWDHWISLYFLRGELLKTWVCRNFIWHPRTEPFDICDSIQQSANAQSIGIFCK